MIRSEKSAKFSTVLNDFVAYLDVEKNLSPRTRKAYVYDLERFADFLVARGGAVKAVDQITTDDIKHYLETHRMDLGHKSTTLSRTIASLRIFFEYCVVQGHLEKSPAVHLHNPKLPKKLPIYLIESELKGLLQAPEAKMTNGGDLKGEETVSKAALVRAKRDYAILVTLSFVGLRVSELVGLNLHDLDLESRMVRVMGKGSKERLLPLNEVVMAALAEWLAVREPADPADDALFLNPSRKRLTTRSVELLVDKYVGAAGIGKHGVSPHKLRHTFATLLHIHGTDILEIQALLGHSSITSTQVYTHANPTRLKTAVKNLENI